MNATEALTLCRYVKAACPQQAIDTYTPDAWFDLLGDLDYAEALEAVKALCRQQPFVAPSEIRGQISDTRSRRIGRFIYIPPDDLPDMRVAGGEGGTDWYLAQRRVANLHEQITMQLVGDGLLVRGDPTPTYEALRRLIDAEVARQAEAERVAAASRQAALADRLS